MSARPAGGLRSAAGIRTAAYYAALFGALGVHLPFWPLWLENWGLSPAEVGAYTAAAIAVRVVAGLVLPVLADRLDARRATLAVTAGFGALAFLAHLSIDDAGVLFFATMASAAVFSGLVPIGDALGMAASRSFGFEYAQARSVGSAAFLVANLGLGAVIASQGPGAALWAIVAFLAATAWLGLTHPGGGKARAAARPTLSDARRLVSSRPFVAFVLAIGLSQASHGVLYAYGSIHWRALGLGEARIGALWAFGVGVEVALMAIWGGALVRRLGATGAIALSAGIGALRWAAMTADPTGALLWALQASHAASFAAGHLGAVAFISAAAPERLAGSAQGFFGAVAGGLLMALGAALAAALYPSQGGGVYWIACAMSLGGLLASRWLARVWRGGGIIA